MALEPLTERRGRILVAEPDRAQAEAWRAALVADGWQVDVAASEREAFEAASHHPYRACVVDVHIMQEAEASLTDMVRRRSPGSQFVVVASRQEVELAVPLLKQGADQFLLKPVPPEELVNELRKLVDALPDVAAAPSESDDQPFEFHGIVGRSQAIRRVIKLVMRVAPSDASVMITGETGVGKELLARAIHELSPRASKPFVAVNAGAIPVNLEDSELFGHKRGAFTDAHSDKKGLLEIANEGTLFFDEIGEMSFEVQAKLLRALERGEIRRVGETESRKVDVRILTATNRDLGSEVDTRRFREDLWFRLNVIQVNIPPLRDRREDIYPLLASFIGEANKRSKRSVVGFSPEALAIIMRYDFPGNIRELRNLVQHAVVMAEKQIISVADLPIQVVARSSSHRLLASGEGGRSPRPSAVVDSGESYASSDENFKTLAQVEKEIIQWTLSKLSGNQTEVAKRLGISRSTLWRKIKEYGLTV